jgi:hypothetical protein
VPTGKQPPMFWRIAVPSSSGSRSPFIYWHHSPKDKNSGLRVYSYNSLIYWKPLPKTRCSISVSKWTLHIRLSQLRVTYFYSYHVQTYFVISADIKRKSTLLNEEWSSKLKTRSAVQHTNNINNNNTCNGQTQLWYPKHVEQSSDKINSVIQGETQKF